MAKSDKTERPGKSEKYVVQVNLPKDTPDDITPYAHVFDTHGQHVSSAAIDKKGQARVDVPQALVGHSIRIAISPEASEAPKLRELRRTNAVTRTLAFDPDDRPVFDIPDVIIADWVLCVCTVRGRVVKAVPQPTGVSIDYPVCNARVHICEVDRLPRIIIRIPDDLIIRVREELLDPPFPPDPFGPRLRHDLLQKRPDLSLSRIGSASPLRSRVEPRQAAETVDLRRMTSELRTTAPVEMTKLARAATVADVRLALVDLSILFPWWCWFPWLDPWWRWNVDCLWTAWTDGNGEFSRTIIYPCSDQPDIYIWVEQFISGSWKTIYARGPRCDTHWNYVCGTEITIHVTHPDAKVCVPPPEIEIPDGVTTWILPMAVGHLEIAGQTSHPGELGWLQTDGTASYAGGPANVNPVTDAPMGGYLQFKMLHSLNLPTAAMPRYSWSYRLRPSPDATIAGGWIRMDETVTRRYQIPGPGGLPLYPVETLGPDADELFRFRPHVPPAGVWPVSGFTEDLWSAKLNTVGMAPGLYQIRVSVHDGGGNIVAPGAGTFRFVATDTRLAGETYDTRLATAGELIDDGFVFDVLVDNAECAAVLHPPQTDSGGVADVCGFLRYADKANTDVTFDFEASHIRDHAWFTLEIVRGVTGLPQVSVLDGGQTGAFLVPVDSNGAAVWPNANYVGDGAGNFSGTFTAQRFLETCDNGAFAADLEVRAKAHNGLRRLWEYDDHFLMGFALAEQNVTP